MTNEQLDKAHELYKRKMDDIVARGETLGVEPKYMIKHQNYFERRLTTIALEKGLNLNKSDERRAAVNELARFAYEDGSILYVETQFKQVKHQVEKLREVIRSQPEGSVKRSMEAALESAIQASGLDLNMTMDELHYIVKHGTQKLKFRGWKNVPEQDKGSIDRLFDMLRRLNREWGLTFKWDSPE